MRERYGQTDEKDARKDAVVLILLISKIIHAIFLSQESLS